MTTAYKCDGCGRLFESKLIEFKGEDGTYELIIVFHIVSYRNKPPPPHMAGDASFQNKLDFCIPCTKKIVSQLGE